MCCLMILKLGAVCKLTATLAHSHQSLSGIDGLRLGLSVVVVLLQSRKSGTTIVL